MIKDLNSEGCDTDRVSARCRSCSPSGLVTETASWQELSVVGTINASSLSGLLISIRIEIVVMNVLGGELTLPCVRLVVGAAIWHIVPSGFGLIGKHHVGAIVPLQPSPHLLRKRPDVFIIWTFMKPMVQWSLEISCVSVDMSRELALKSWNNVVECESVS